MIKVQEYEIDETVLYHKEHMWIRVEGDVGMVGVDDFTQKAAGEVTYIELPSEGDEFEAGELAGSLETGKWIGKLYCPVAGEVIEVNESVTDDPAIINRDPYGEGWLFKIKLKDRAELDELMKPQDAVKWLEKEIETHIKK